MKIVWTETVDKNEMFYVEYTVPVSCSLFEILKQTAFYTGYRQYAPETLDYMDLS
jgi:hypothetical protein